MIESTRKPDLSAQSIRSHLVDAFKELGELNRRQQNILEEWARLAERKQLIKMAVVQTALQIIENFPLGPGEVTDTSEGTVGKVRLSLPGISFAIIRPTRRLLTLLTENANSTNDVYLECIVKRFKPHPIQKEDGPIVDFHRMQIELAYQQGRLGLNLAWDEDPKNPGAKLEFSYDINNPVVSAALEGIPLIDPDDEWRTLEDASGFLTLFEKSRVVLFQSNESGNTD